MLPFIDENYRKKLVDEYFETLHSEGIIIPYLMLDTYVNVWLMIFYQAAIKNKIIVNNGIFKELFEKERSD